MKKQYFYPDKHEPKNQYKNGEEKRMNYKKCGYSFTYEYKTTYMHGIGNNLSGLIHSLLSHGNVQENVKVYKNGILIKEWDRH